MQRGTWIVFENTAGEIGRKFVPDVEGQEPELNEAVYDAMTSDHWLFQPGDTIRFIEGESEIV